mmetsp:Transcript_26065/g.74160  ORF Transcript_26065/g.74160 Transcript_26065/m.74160 type:complete len:253 (-) Transcript_26065:236-994(-)
MWSSMSNGASSIWSRKSPMRSGEIAPTPVRRAPNLYITRRTSTGAPLNIITLMTRQPWRGSLLSSGSLSNGSMRSATRSLTGTPTHPKNMSSRSFEKLTQGSTMGKVSPEGQMLACSTRRPSSTTASKRSFCMMGRGALGSLTMKTPALSKTCACNCAHSPLNSSRVTGMVNSNGCKPNCASRARSTCAPTTRSRLGGACPGTFSTVTEPGGAGFNASDCFAKSLMCLILWILKPNESCMKRVATGASSQRM